MRRNQKKRKRAHAECKKIESTKQHQTQTCEQAPGIQALLDAFSNNFERPPGGRRESPRKVVGKAGDLGALPVWGWVMSTFVPP